VKEFVLIVDGIYKKYIAVKARVLIILYVPLKNVSHGGALIVSAYWILKHIASAIYFDIKIYTIGAYTQ
jgi:hypothetical protein